MLNEINNLVNNKESAISQEKKLQELSKAAAQFESIFLSQILKESMPEGNDGDTVLFGESTSRNIYRSMMFDAVAEEMANAGGIGLQKKIVEQYMEMMAPSKTQSDKINNFKDIKLKEVYISSNQINNGNIIFNTDYKVSSHFGFRNDPFTDKKKFHYGIDLAAPEGTKIFTPVSGKIIFSGELKGYGKTVKIQGDDNKTYIFGHLSDFNVKEGDKITRKTYFGKVGSTGRSTGPHLHFEIRDSENNAINPEKIFVFNSNQNQIAMQGGN